MSLRTCCKTFSLLFVILATAILAVPAFGQAGTCMQDEFDAFNGTPGVTVNCTANDVSVAKVTGFEIISGGFGNKCLINTQFTFVADFEILTTSQKTRSNIGLYFGTGTGAGQNGALTGTCSDSILSPTFTCPGTGPGTSHPTAVTCGDINYEELDQAINGEPGTGSPIGCGDTSSSDNGGFGPGTQAAEIEVGPITCPLPANTVPCPAGSGFTGSCMPLPECTSWWQPTTTMPLCETPAPTFPYVNTAVPGTKSKCSCTTLFIPVQPVEPAISVAKACSVGGGAFTNPCDLGAEGGTVTYQVTITNTTPAGEGGVNVDQICDDRYGNIFTAAGFSGPACPAGTVGSIVAGSASSCAALGDITTSASCTFQAVQGENLTIVDDVTVNGHSDLSSSVTFAPKTSNTVTVTSEDAPTTAKTNKGLEPGPLAACVTLRYDVTVRNTSAADETIHVTALNDNAYGNIDTTHGSASVDASVVGTTCGVDSGLKGLGTLSGSAGAGAFPQTLAPGTGAPPTSNGGTYTCQFDGVICGTPSGSAVPNCAFGLSKPDTVTATLTGDETSAPLDQITETEVPFTANVCLVQSGQ